MQSINQYQHCIIDRMSFQTYYEQNQSNREEGTSPVGFEEEKRLEISMFLAVTEKPLILVHTPMRESEDSIFSQLLIQDVLSQISEGERYKSTHERKPEVLENIGIEVKMQPLQKNPKMRKISYSTTYKSIKDQRSIDLNDDLDNQDNLIKGCNCKRSSCLKNYCECFKSGAICSSACQCFQCKNKQIQIHQSKHKKSSNNLDIGCNCKKSQCLKNYCECYNSGRRCSEFCNCTSCQNYYEPVNSDQDKHNIYAHNKASKKVRLA